MTDKQYADFVLRYRELRLGSMDFEFVLSWREKLDAFDFPSLINAVLDVAADPRASFPLNDLPILMEHANAHAQKKNRSTEPKKAWGPRPLASEMWDRRMLEIGAIDVEEFNRRQAKRKGSAA